MKRILLLLTLIGVMSGCVSIPKYPYRNYSTVIDYSEFTDKGFFITEANSVSFDYKALGSIAVSISGGYEVLGETGPKSNNDDIYARSKNNIKIKYGNYIPAYMPDALDALYNEAVETGANGIINLKMSFGDERVSVSGMAIKR